MERSIALRSVALGVTGKADVVEFPRGGGPVPVEYTGRFLARVEGQRSGNVLLRRTQYRAADDPAWQIPIVRAIVAAKAANQRTVLRRALRDHAEALAGLPLDALEFAERRLTVCGRQVLGCADVAQLRGLEGEAAGVYFGVFDHLVRVDGEAFRFCGRSRRPPLDRSNALLSFLYAMLGHDCRSALEAHGLDPQVGFLHADRPGRASLALDLMEELRPVLADRVALSLINRRQIVAADFVVEAAGGVRLTDDARKTVLTAWQDRKRDEIRHPFLDESDAVRVAGLRPGAVAGPPLTRRLGRLSGVLLEVGRAMLMLVTYDVNTEDAAGRRRLRRVARACLDWGQRVQFSVFECEVDPAQWVALRARLLGEVDVARDSLRFYRLGKAGRAAVEHVGAKAVLDLEEPLVF